jgi:hypothetical protein
MLADHYAPVVKLLKDNDEEVATEWPGHRKFLHLWQRADPDGVFLRYSRSKDGVVSDPNGGLGMDCRYPYEAGHACARYIAFNEDYLDEQGWFVGPD